MAAPAPNKTSAAQKNSQPVVKTLLKKDENKTALSTPANTTAAV